MGAYFATSGNRAATIRLLRTNYFVEDLQALSLTADDPNISKLSQVLGYSALGKVEAGLYFGDVTDLTQAILDYAHRTGCAKAFSISAPAVMAANCSLMLSIDSHPSLDVMFLFCLTCKPGISQYHNIRI